jgi:hypothetical protein
MQSTCAGIMLAIGALTTKPAISREGELDTYTLLAAGISNSFSLDASRFLRFSTFEYLRFPNSSSHTHCPIHSYTRKLTGNGKS